MQRTTIWLAFSLLGGGVPAVSAQSPPPDTSPGFFTGEWTGTGASGSYCYISLRADGTGWVLIDVGAGDWNGARIQWRNRQQSLQVDRSVPVPASPGRRLLPLTDYTLRSTFNASLSLTWTNPGGSCQLERLEATALHLNAARTAILDLPPTESQR